MAFKIKIIEIKTVKTMGRQWAVTGQKKPDGTDIYDYTPEFEMDKEVEIERLSQVVDEIDMTCVIKAINGLPA